MGFFDLFKKKKTTEEPKPTTPIAASPEESVAAVIDLIRTKTEGKSV